VLEKERSGTILEINIVMVPTPRRAQTTKTERPAGVSGVKSPYPMVVNAITPIFDENMVTSGKGTTYRNTWRCHTAISP